MNQGLAQKLKIAVASALGLGLLPIMPGTFGALLGVAFHGLIVLVLPADWRQAALLAVLLVVALTNHLLTPWATAYWHSPDPGNFVLDEVAGYLMVPIILPAYDFALTATVGFILFRVFDIIKLPGARYFDRQVKGSWGILLDDLISGTYAAIVLFALVRLRLL